MAGPNSAQTLGINELKLIETIKEGRAPPKQRKNKNLQSNVKVTNRDISHPHTDRPAHFYRKAQLT